MRMDRPVGFRFTEEMRGFVSFGQTAYDRGRAQGEAAGETCMFHVTVRIPDLDAFLTSPEHAADIVGHVETARQGRCAIERGRFNLFVDTADRNSRKMLYRLFYRDAEGRPFTLNGYKMIQDQPGPDVWGDTTTLFTNLFAGHVEAEREAGAEIAAAGILHISLADFLRQLTTLRADAPGVAERVRAFEAFGRFFLGALWDTYGPSLMPKPGRYVREIPLHTTEGVKGAEITAHPFHSVDKLGLALTRFCRREAEDVVLIVHGLTQSSDMFIMPEHYNLVQYLLDHGWGEVWTLDFRMSNRYPYNLQRTRWTLDDVALFDLPPALAELRRHLPPGARIHVVCHCLGSVSFMMSLFGRAVSGIASVVSNSVSLTPRVPAWSRLKLWAAPFLCETVMGFQFANPNWRREPGVSMGKALGWVASAFHKECGVPECGMLSFMWGTGFPALFSHENLDDVTHRRVGDLHGGVSFHYYRHVRRMVEAGAAVKYDPADPRFHALPDTYLQNAADIATPVLFVTGENNRVFTDSNIETHKRLDAVAPGRHELHVFPNYGHQDVFMGKNAHQDVFPRMAEFLDRHKGGAC